MKNIFTNNIFIYLCNRNEKTCKNKGHWIKQSSISSINSNHNHNRIKNTCKSKEETLACLHVYETERKSLLWECVFCAFDKLNYELKLYISDRIVADFHKGFSLRWKWSRHHFLVKRSTNRKYQIKWKVEIIKTFVISFFSLVPLPHTVAREVLELLLLLPTSGCCYFTMWKMDWKFNFILFCSHPMYVLLYSKTVYRRRRRLRSPQLNFRPNSRERKKNI